MTSQGLIGVFAVFALSCTLHAQHLSYDPEQLTLVAREDLPSWGTFWVQGPNGPAVPLPFPPGDMPDAPIYALPNGQFLVDGSAVQRSGMRTSAMNIPVPYGEDTPDDPQTPPPNIPNYQKFMGQAFSLIDTNDAAVNDPDLYNGCVSFPDDTNTAPFLQIARYGTNALIIKTNHFDYSAETRGFALLICDKVETPTWKNIDLSGSSDSQDGWLIQGSVPDDQVTDPMFLMVSNINLAYNAFFRAIPYGGPQVQITGAQPYDTVTAILSLQAVIADLSGTSSTNQQFTVTVNLLPARYALASGNTIALETTYAPSGIQEVEVALGSAPLIFDPQNPPLDTQLTWATTATLLLAFENSAFLVNASDMCSPD